eukprot:scaffold2643_cov387-Prasinococcus_capsulatus_cf.AAC.6
MGPHAPSQVRRGLHGEAARWERERPYNGRSALARYPTRVRGFPHSGIAWLRLRRREVQCQLGAASLCTILGNYYIAPTGSTSFMDKGN